MYNVRTIQNIFLYLNQVVLTGTPGKLMYIMMSLMTRVRVKCASTGAIIHNASPRSP
jgi:hypothetical protein